MHFVRDTVLAQRFKDNDVPSRERLYYLLFTEMLMGLFVTSLYIDWFYCSASLNA